MTTQLAKGFGSCSWVRVPCRLSMDYALPATASPRTAAFASCLACVGKRSTFAFELPATDAKAATCWRWSRSRAASRRAAAPPSAAAPPEAPPSSEAAILSSESARPLASICSRSCSPLAPSTVASRRPSAALIRAAFSPSDCRMAARFLRSAAICISIDETISGEGWMSRTSMRVTSMPQPAATALASSSSFWLSRSRAANVWSRVSWPISERSCVRTRFVTQARKSSTA
mmetsp:Transcript_49709/g.160749  ORF Transcript_49709/g.160749 Transcript_49709/m.160749 type:complete len:231 (+) Transcript_49709:122-814(+)